MSIFFTCSAIVCTGRYCTGCNSCNISHRLNLMLRKLTFHMSKLAIRVLQISPISLLFSIFTSAAVYTLHSKFEFQKLSLLSSTRVFLSASLSLMLFSALFSTPTVPPAQPLLRLAGFDKSGLGLVGLPQNPQISFRLYHPQLKSAGTIYFRQIFADGCVYFIRIFIIIISCNQSLHFNRISFILGSNPFLVYLSYHVSICDCDATSKLSY